MIGYNANAAVPRGSRRVDREELSWAAGFFDGEGCVSYAVKGRYACVTMMKVDSRVLDRFLNAVGVGKVYGPYTFKNPDRYSRQPKYQYRAHRREDVQAMAALLWFQLGPVKRQQATMMRRKVRRRCSKGHPLVQARGCPRCVADA